MAVRDAFQCMLPPALFSIWRFALHFVFNFADNENSCSEASSMLSLESLTFTFFILLSICKIYKFYCYPNWGLKMSKISTKILIFAFLLQTLQRYMACESTHGRRKDFFQGGPLGDFS